MKKALLIAVGAAFLLSGCGSTRTTYSTDRMGAPLQTTEERSFFSSENLGDYYQFEAKRIDNHNAAVNSKLTAIKENIAARMTTVKMTATEALLMSVIDAQTIAAIPVDSPAPMKAPKTMVDVLDGNFLLNAVNTGVNLYNQTRANNNRSKNDGDDVTVVNSGTMGDINLKSFNKSGTLTVDNQSTGSMDFSEGKTEAAPAEETPAEVTPAL